jgi:hypothetical protein
MCYKISRKAYKYRAAANNEDINFAATYIREIGKLTKHVGTKTRPSLNHIVFGLLMHSSLVVTP